MLSAPRYVSEDLYILVRQAICTYGLFFYVNADERRQDDPYFRGVYSILLLPLIRNVIDCLYNITSILQDPAGTGAWFRKSGYKRELADLEEDRQRYGGRAEWDEWLAKRASAIDLSIRVDNFALSDVQSTNNWPTLGTYVRSPQTGGIFSPHQQFLKPFTYGNWRKYSAMAHGAYEGLLNAAPYYASDILDDANRESLEDSNDRTVSLHLGRVATLLLCIITELQAYFGFDSNGARIGERMHEMWNALIVIPECKELHEGHYEQLMEDRHI